MAHGVDIYLPGKLPLKWYMSLIQVVFVNNKLASIYKACDSKDIRRAMFSATFSYDVEEWCRLNLDNVVQVYVGAR